MSPQHAKSQPPASPPQAPRKPPASPRRAPRGPRPAQIRRRTTFLENRLTPRVRDLFTDLMTDRKDVGAYLESQCLKVAELTARAEDLRAKLEAMLAAEGVTADEVKAEDSDAEVKSIATLINAVTRLESTARRAAADLGKIGPAEDPDSWGKIQDEADRFDEEERLQKLAQKGKNDETNQRAD